MGRSLKKGPFTDTHLSKRWRFERQESEDSGEDVVAPLDDYA